MAQSDFSVEQLVKTGTAILAVLFILGFLISNLHLMDFGISDFTSFNSRNVMVGALFLVWVTILILPILPILFYVYLWRADAMAGLLWKGLWLLFVGGTIYCLICAGGLLVGFLNPWGRAWEDGMTLMTSGPKTWLADFHLGFTQFLENFGNLRTLVGAMGLTVAGIIFVVNYAARERNEEPIFDFPESGFGYWAEVLYAAMASSLLLSGFAQSVYPNMLYNLGGGQPAFAEIVLDIAPEDRALRLPDILSEARHQSTVVRTEPLVIWHQSDKFIHVRPFSQTDAERVRLISLALSDVKTILYLDRVARFGQGGAILDPDPRGTADDVTPAE